MKSDDRLKAILRARREERDGTKSTESQAGLWDRRPSPAGHALADAGAKAAADRAERISAGYKAAARELVLELVKDGQTVTSEEVRERLPPPEGADPRALGHVFRMLSKEGLIERAGYVQSTRPTSHVCNVAVWKASA